MKEAGSDAGGVKDASQREHLCVAVLSLKALGGCAGIQCQT